jgi:hypothetical protein
MKLLLFVQALVFFQAISQTQAQGNGRGNGGQGGQGGQNIAVEATCLNQDDFNQGTLIITEPGTYQLCEDITFYPQVNPPTSSSEGAADAFEPIFPGAYDENAFGLGFFAAISIATSDVTINLNGYTIEQSQEHALLQRFFAVIELADSPFIKGAGPAQFVGESNYLNSGSNIQILGPGTIGRSSHHGIHGNNNSNVVVDSVTFTDFEVAAVAINNANNLSITNCNISQNRHDVPVLGMFSAAKFIRPYGKILKDVGFTMDLRGVETSASDVYDSLVESINNVFNDIMASGSIQSSTHPDEYDLFHNEHGVVDGPCYAFLIHGEGPAVGDFAFAPSLNATKSSSSIIIRDNVIKNIDCAINEVPAIVEENRVMNDARGAVFQLVRSSDGAPIAMNDDGTYKGNVVADMQIMVAKAIIDGIIQSTPQLQTIVKSLDGTISDWASSTDVTYDPQFRCNGDSMHHVVKGVAIIRVDDALGFRIDGNKIQFVNNFSPPSFSNCYDYHKGANVENADDVASLQQSTNIRGISVSAVTGFDEGLSSISGNDIRKLSSDNAQVIVGIDIQGKSNSISIFDNTVNLKGGVFEDPNDEFIALRLREYSDGFENNIIVNNNSFTQEVQTMAVTNVPVSGCENGGGKEKEWEVGKNVGGCPFGFKA